MTALTLPNIKNAQPGDLLRDDKLKGLQLRATSERKAFYFYYRVRGTGAEKRPKLGDWPALSLDAARLLAGQWIAVIAAGGDPTKTRGQEAEAPTVNDLCGRFLAWTGVTVEQLRTLESYSDEDIARHIEACKTTEPKDPPLGDRSRIDYARVVQGHIRPRMGAWIVADVETSDVAKVHKAMKKIPFQANRVRVTVSKMFNLAEAWALRPLKTNPATRVTPYPEPKRKRYAAPDEARAIFLLLAKYADRYPQQVAFLWLLIYTGARPKEIATARSEWRDGNRLDMGLNHKTAHHGRKRVIQLPPQAVAVLDKLGRTPNGTLTGIKSPEHLWRIILAESGLAGANLRMYDLRHSFASIGIAAGMTLEDIGGLLGHASPATTQRYAHLMDHVARARAATIADGFDAMAGVTIPAEDDDPLS